MGFFNYEEIIILKYNFKKFFYVNFFRQVSEDELEISKKTNELTKLLNKDYSKPKNWKNNVKMLYKECASHLPLEVMSNLMNDLIMQDDDMNFEFPSNQKTREISDLESRAVELFQSYVNKYGYSNVSSQSLSQILKLFKNSPHQPIPWTTLVIGKRKIVIYRVLSLLRNKRFLLKFLSRQNASKFAILFL